MPRTIPAILEPSGQVRLLEPVHIATPCRVLLTLAEAPESPRPRASKIAPPGGMAGEIWIADDFDAPLDDLFDLEQERDAP